jgi:hypothetical protein
MSHSHKLVQTILKLPIMNILSSSYVILIMMSCARLNPTKQSLPERKDCFEGKIILPNQSFLQKRSKRGTKRKTRTPTRSPSPPNYKSSCEEIVCWENSDCTIVS